MFLCNCNIICYFAVATCPVVGRGYCYYTISTSSYISFVSQCVCLGNYDLCGCYRNICGNCEFSTLMCCHHLSLLLSFPQFNGSTEIMWLMIISGQSGSPAGCVGKYKRWLLYIVRAIMELWIKIMSCILAFATFSHSSKMPSWRLVLGPLKGHFGLCLRPHKKKAQNKFLYIIYVCILVKKKYGSFRVQECT